MIIWSQISLPWRLVNVEQLRQLTFGAILNLFHFEL